MAGSAHWAPRGYQFNQDPEWHKFVSKYEPVILQVAVKYCMADEFMRDDLMQEARIGLLTIDPKEIYSYEAHKKGEISDGKYYAFLDRYCRNVIRNSILSYLDSYSKGNWYIGRTKRIRDPETGKVNILHKQSRFDSLDELEDEYGMQVDEDGVVSWPSFGDGADRMKSQDDGDE